MFIIILIFLFCAGWPRWARWRWRRTWVDVVSCWAVCWAAAGAAAAALAIGGFGGGGDSGRAEEAVEAILAEVLAAGPTAAERVAIGKQA